MKKNNFFGAAMMIIAMSGFTYYVNWQGALFLFLAMWANNVGLLGGDE